jgi:hypothetical protein
VTVDWGSNDPEDVIRADPGDTDGITVTGPLDGVDLPAVTLSEAAVNRMIGSPPDRWIGVPGTDLHDEAMLRLALQVTALRYRLIFVDASAEVVLAVAVPRYELVDGESEERVAMVRFAITEGGERFLVRLAGAP